MGKPDDDSTMKEVIYRRYYRVLVEDLPKPDLIVMDGGIGQVNAANEVLNELSLDIPVVGLVKNSKHITSHLIDSNNKEYKINVRSCEFKLLSRIQDEVHRFAITFHKNVRMKGIYNSILDSIEGLGEVRKSKLLKKFKTIENIKKCSIKEIVELGIPEKIAMDILNKISDN